MWNIYTTCYNWSLQKNRIIWFFQIFTHTEIGFGDHTEISVSLLPSERMYIMCTLNNKIPVQNPFRTPFTLRNAIFKEWFEVKAQVTWLTLRTIYQFAAISNTTSVVIIITSSGFINQPDHVTLYLMAKKSPV